MIHHLLENFGNILSTSEDVNYVDCNNDCEDVQDDRCLSLLSVPHVVRDSLWCLHTVISMEMKSRVSIVIIVLTRVTTVTTSYRPPVSTRVSKIKLNGPMLGL